MPRKRKRRRSAADLRDGDNNRTSSLSIFVRMATRQTRSIFATTCVCLSVRRILRSRDGRKRRSVPAHQPQMLRSLLLLLVLWFKRCSYRITDYARRRSDDLPAPRRIRNTRRHLVGAPEPHGHGVATAVAYAPACHGAIFLFFLFG